MHPAEISTYLAEKEAQKEHILDAYASTTITIPTTLTTEQAHDNIRANHGDQIADEVEYFGANGNLHEFHFVAPINFEGTTPEYALATLADEYPTIHTDKWELT